MKALVTGATGFIGKRLVGALDRPVVLSRNPHRAEQVLGGVGAFAWSAEDEPAPPRAFDGIDVIFHLAGESVGEGRWTADKKRRIMESRRQGTRNLIAGLKNSGCRPRAIVSASAVGYYGNRGNELLSESAPPGNDFLAQVCIEWEAAAREAEKLGIRVAMPRLGVVLGPGGGALAKMLPIFKLGLGGRLASGWQWMPWVQLDDVIGMLLFAAENEAVRGPFNTVAPNPVTNREFTRILASILHRPALFPAPAFGLRIMIGEFAEVLLASQRVVPQVMSDLGYRFQFSELRSALAATITSMARNSGI